MGIGNAIRRGANWLFNTPNGCLTFGLIYGASVTYLWCKHVSEVESAVDDAYLEGINCGLDMAEKVENGEKLVYFTDKSGKKTKIFTLKKAENESKDYGAKMATSCTIDENEAPSE